MYKLLTRRAKCLQYISDSSEEDLTAVISEALEALTISDLNDKGKELWERTIRQLTKQNGSAATSTSHSDIKQHKSNASHPALSASANVFESNEFGRYVGAKETIQPGDIVLVETPFCSVTLPDCYLTHCFYCQRRVQFCMYPCRRCADVVYCNTICEQAAWVEVHQYECDHILSLKAVGVNMGHLALRSALKAGYKLLVDIHKDEADNHYHDTYEAYSNIYGLQDHEEDRSGKDLFWRTVAAVVLAQMCNLDSWSMSSDDGLLVLATAVLQHMQSFPCNAHEISEILYDAKYPFQSESQEIGAGIYASLSMFNHSCDPSVVRTFENGNTCVMKALSPIGKSEQIYDNYGCLYATHTLQQRQQKLRSQYHFSCCCSACLQDWPLYENLSYDDVPVYRCESCQSMLFPPFSAACDKCCHPFAKASVDKKLETVKTALNSILSKLFTAEANSHDFHALAAKLEDYSLVANSLVFRPYKSLNDCQEAVKHLYGCLGNVCTKV